LQEKKLLSINDTAAKVVGGGKLTKKLTLEGVAATKSVIEQVKTAGGEIK